MIEYTNGHEKTSSSGVASGSTYARTTVRSPGAIGVDACHGAAACLDGQTSRGLAAWVFYPAPFAGGVRLLGVASPGVLIIDDSGHQLRFTIVSGVSAR